MTSWVKKNDYAPQSHLILASKMKINSKIKYNWLNLSNLSLLQTKNINVFWVIPLIYIFCGKINKTPVSQSVSQSVCQTQPYWMNRLLHRYMFQFQKNHHQTVHKKYLNQISSSCFYVTLHWDLSNYLLNHPKIFHYSEAHVM